MESHGRQENCKAAQSFHQDQSVRTSKGREVWTMVCGGPCRLPSQEVPNAEPMQPSFGRTIDRGFLKSLRTPRFECFYFDTLPPTCSPLHQRRLSSILRDKASNDKPPTYDASHGSGKYRYRYSQIFGECMEYDCRNDVWCFPSCRNPFTYDSITASCSCISVRLSSDKVMMIQNIAVDQRFANGTQGRLLHWHPSATQSKGKALPAYCQELLARFCKESALSKKELMPGVCFYLL